MWACVQDKHQPKMNAGIVIKTNANQRYATSAISSFVMKEAASRAGVGVQEFAVRQDAMCGSTIGPILSTSMGLRTVDVGLAQLRCVMVGGGSVRAAPLSPILIVFARVHVCVQHALHSRDVRLRGRRVVRAAVRDVLFGVCDDRRPHHACGLAVAGGLPMHVEYPFRVAYSLDGIASSTVCSVSHDPPSTTRMVPVTYDAAGDARYSTALPMSSRDPSLCKGISLVNRSNKLGATKPPARAMRQDSRCDHSTTNENRQPQRTQSVHAFCLCDGSRCHAVDTHAIHPLHSNAAAAYSSRGPTQ